jgi:cell division protein FtsB
MDAKLPYNPKLPLKYYRDYRKNCERHVKQMKILFFFLVAVAMFVIGPALIYGVMTVIDYLKR